MNMTTINQLLSNVIVCIVIVLMALVNIFNGGFLNLLFGVIMLIHSLPILHKYFIIKTIDIKGNRISG